MLAEFASIQMEFKTLSHHVKDPKYAEKAEGMIKPLHAAFPDVVSFGFCLCIEFICSLCQIANEMPV